MMGRASQLLGVGLRAAAVGVGVTPAVVGALVDGAGFSAVIAQALVVFASAAVLLGERRDASYDGVIGRAAGCGIVASVLLAFMATWAAHAGDLDAGYAAIALLARRDLSEPLLGLLGVALLTPVWSLLLQVRAHTDRVDAQALAGAITGCAVVVMRGSVSCRHHPVPVAWATLIVLSGALAGVAVALVDRWLDARTDAAPRSRPVRSKLAASGLAATLFLGTLCLACELPRSLRGTHNCCGVSFGNEGARYALRSAVEPLQACSTPGPVSSTVRFARAAGRWCATVDSACGGPGDLGRERYWINQQGALYQALADEVPPLVLDPAIDSDQLPPGWHRFTPTRESP